MASKHKHQTVMLAYPHGTFEGGFVTSLVMLLVHDAHKGRHIVNGGYFLSLQTTNIPHGRNQIVRTFLEQTDADWLWFVDTDQTFPPDTLERMLASAHPTDRPILGALVFSYTRGDAQEIVPTLWTLRDDKLARILQIPGDGLLPLLATGTGCVLIHRSVLEGVRDFTVPGTEHTFGDTSWPWFQYTDWVNADGKPDVLGEDLTFFLRAAAAGYPTFVDTRIEVGHVKRWEIGREQYERQPLPVAALPNFAVIPVKGQHHLTDHLVAQLKDEADAIFILDNGFKSDPYPNPHGVHVINAEGWNIHRMWNAGVRACVAGSPRCNIAILNNDLDVQPGFLAGLAQELRADPRRLAVSPNYDTRPGSGFMPVKGICANRYDGTGGLAGFAFMVPGEMFAAGFPMFDESLTWWYGDSDFVLNVDKFGGVYGIALDVPCVHIDGGSQSTIHDEVFQATIAEDRRKFEAKWSAS